MSVHVSDGTQGGITGFFMIILYRLNMILADVVDKEELISTIFLAAVGAVVGFFVHLTLQLITNYFKKKKK